MQPGEIIGLLRWLCLREVFGGGFADREGHQIKSHFFCSPHFSQTVKTRCPVDPLEV